MCVYNYREVIEKRPYEFKIDCLQQVRALFPDNYCPLHAGFGNRHSVSDVWGGDGVYRYSEIVLLFHPPTIVKASGMVGLSFRLLASLQKMQNCSNPCRKVVVMKKRQY